MGDITEKSLNALKKLLKTIDKDKLTEIVNSIDEMLLPSLDIVNFDNFKRIESWDYLMSFVEKIESLENYCVEIIEKSCFIYDISKLDDNPNAFIIENGKTKLEAVYKAVVKFIEFYNNENN